MRNVFRKYIPGLCAGLILTSCSAGIPGGAAQVKVIQPTGQRCHYSIAPATLSTLDNLNDVSGKIGRVVTSKLNLDSNASILDTGTGFDPIDTQFLRSGSVYSAENFATLYAVSLYYAIETGYLLHAGLAPEADFVKNVPGFTAKTLIVQDAIRNSSSTEGGGRVTDNAEFLPHSYKNNGVSDTRNYILSYPTDTIKDMPLGLNLGIMVHEYSHLVFEYFFYAKALAKKTGTGSDKPTQSTLDSINEGYADYFGYLATKDPAFFLCSFPSENRDLSVPKTFTSDMNKRIQSDPNFDPHEGGAVFAAINYEIGQAIGFDVNAKLLEKLAQTLLDCPSAQTSGATNSVSLDMAAVAACHAAVDGTRSSVVQGIYNKYLTGFQTGGGT